jgi:hypothetical protein
VHLQFYQFEELAYNNFHSTKEIVVRELRVLTLALTGVLLTGTERLEAAPIVFFLNQPTAIPKQLITDVGVPFAIDIDTGGSFSRIYENATGLLITDFHFRSSAPEATVWIGGGGAPPPFFQTVIAVPEATGIDFYQGPIGTGILPGQVFEISGSGFIVNSGTGLTALASVPEPAGPLLCFAGLVALVVRCRRTQTSPLTPSSRYWTPKSLRPRRAVSSRAS